MPAGAFAPIAGAFFAKGAGRKCERGQIVMNRPSSKVMRRYLRRKRKLLQRAERKTVRVPE